MSIRKSHHSWFIGWFCFGIIIGAALCIVVPPQIFNRPYIVLSSAIGVGFCFCLRWHILIVIALAGGVITGLCRGSPVLISLKTYEPYYGQILHVSGHVSQDASIGDAGDQKITINHVTINDKNFPGTIWISAKQFDIKRGDKITIQGKLNPGFGNMAATMYRASIIDVVRPSPGDVARRARDWFAGGVRRSVPEPQVSLGLGYLVGQKTALPKDLEQDIKTVGLTHAVVASGYNLTILVVFARAVFLKISKYMATLCSILMVLSFMTITGFSPSMSRAGLVACLGLLVWYYGRKTHPFVLLSFAAAVTIMINPNYVWGDLGWYLSFSSFIGVIVLAPLIHHYFWGMRNEPSIVRSLMVETLSAQIVTLPLIQYAFGLYSVYALPANMMVLPLVPIAMLCTFIAGIAGLVITPLAHLFGIPAYWILKYSTSVISWWAHLPNSQIELKFNSELMLASYIVICTLIIFLIRRTHHDFRA